MSGRVYLPVFQEIKAKLERYEIYADICCDYMGAYDIFYGKKCERVFQAFFLYVSSVGIYGGLCSEQILWPWEN